jgi:hypothetical protein
MLRFAVGMAALCGTFAFASETAASKLFPGKIQSTLDVPCELSCTLCHLTHEGGPERIDPNKHFVEAILGAGAVIGDEDSLPAALSRMERECTTFSGFSAKACDTDNDGVGDIQELKEGRDPNEPGEGTLCGPRHGCGARVARGAAEFDWVALLIAGAAATALALGARRSR